MDVLLQTILPFLFAFCVIVFIHEGGHFLAARLFGVRVHVFSLGFGNRLWGFRRGVTDYRIAALPLGGYVQMGGVVPEDCTGEPDDFLAKPRWQRIIIYLAGPFMNLVLAVLLIAGVFTQGIEMQAFEEFPAVVGTVQEDSPAEAAGILPGDRILEANGKAMKLWKDFSFVVATSPERPVKLLVERDGEPLDLEVVPRKTPRYETGEAGLFPQVRLRFAQVIADSPAERAGLQPGDVVLAAGGQQITGFQDFIDLVKAHADQPLELELERGEEHIVTTVTPETLDEGVQIGVLLSIYRRLPLGEALVASVRFNIDIIVKSVEILGKLFTTEIAPKSALSGPIEIANWAGQAAQRGFKDLIYMMGFLSVSIGFMNLLPIPLLDGGHIALLLVESARRKDLSWVTKERVNQVGFFLLVGLMITVIIFDLSKNLPGLFSG